MTKEKLKKLSKNLISDKENYMSSFHKNVNMYISQPDFTIRELAELSGLPFSTINTFLYGSSKDCKLSTAIHLSRAVHISVDELVGCETLSPDERLLIQKYRGIAPRIRHLLHWFLDFQSTLSEASQPSKDRFITVMEPRSDEYGNLYPTNHFTSLNIRDCMEEIKPQVFLGIHIPCCNYMPEYSPYDILLIANDRSPRLNEDCVILLGGKLFLAKRVQTMDGICFHSIRDERPHVTESELDSVLGYVAGVKADNSYVLR